MCLLGLRGGGATLSKGGGGGEGLLCPHISGAYSSYWGGGDATLSTGEGGYSAPLFRWPSLPTGVGGDATLSTEVTGRGGTLPTGVGVGPYSVYGGKGGGPTLPHYFNGLLSLLGRGGYSVQGERGAYSAPYFGGLLCLLGWGWLLCSGGEGAYCAPLFLGPTLPTGVGGGGGAETLLCLRV